MVVGSVSLAELITGQHVPEGSAPSHFNRSTRIEKCPAWRWWDSVPTMAGLIRIILRERLRPALEPINHGSSRFGTTNHFARLGIAPKRLGAGTILRAVTWPKGAYEPLQLVTVPILSAISTGGYTEAPPRPPPSMSNVAIALSPPMCLAVAKSDIMSPQPVRAKWADRSRAL
jgi:hypothetical protein